MPIPLVPLVVKGATTALPFLSGLFGGGQDKVNDTQIEEAFSREWLVKVQPVLNTVGPEEACELIAVGDRNEAQTLAAFVRSESRSVWHTFPHPGAIWAEWKVDLRKRCSENVRAGAGAGTLAGPDVEGGTGTGLFASFLPGILPTGKPGEFPLVPVVLLGGGFLLMVVLITLLGRR